MQTSSSFPFLAIAPHPPEASVSMQCFPSLYSCDNGHVHPSVLKHVCFPVSVLVCLQALVGECASPQQALWVLVQVLVLERLQALQGNCLHLPFPLPLLKTPQGNCLHLPFPFPFPLPHLSRRSRCWFRYLCLNACRHFRAAACTFGSSASKCSATATWISLALLTHM